MLHVAIYRVRTMRTRNEHESLHSESWSSSDLPRYHCGTSLEVLKQGTESRAFLLNRTDTRCIQMIRGVTVAEREHRSLTGDCTCLACNMELVIWRCRFRGCDLVVGRGPRGASSHVSRGFSPQVRRNAFVISLCVFVQGSLGENMERLMS